NPPCRVGRELESRGVVEFLDGADQAEVALLNQVEKLHAAAGVPLRERDDQSKVGAEQVALGALAVSNDPAQFALELLRQSFCCGQLVFGEQPRFDAHGQLDLFGGVEQ